MSCDISHGRIEPCKDAVGGLKNLYILNYGLYDETDITYDTTVGYEDVITGITLTPIAPATTAYIYKFELKGTNSFEQTITSSRENGTTFFEQVLTVMLKKQDAITHKQIKLLSYGRPNIIVENNNGQYFIAGLLRGMDVTAGTISNGTALGDMNGYSLTFTGQEATPANFLDAATEAQLVTLLNNPTVVNS
jgi:hypothetical protein